MSLSRAGITNDTGSDVCCLVPPQTVEEYVLRSCCKTDTETAEKGYRIIKNNNILPPNPVFMPLLRFPGLKVILIPVLGMVSYCQIIGYKRTDRQKTAAAVYRSVTWEPGRDTEIPPGISSGT
jgi:hypothetical protein